MILSRIYIHKCFSNLCHIHTYPFYRICCSMDTRSYFKPLSLKCQRLTAGDGTIMILRHMLLHRFFFHFTQTKSIWLNMSLFYIGPLQHVSNFHEKQPAMCSTTVDPQNIEKGLAAQVSLLLFVFSSILNFLQNSGPMLFCLFVWVGFKVVGRPTLRSPLLSFAAILPFTATSSTLHLSWP